ncbi:MAG: hypothetical protein KDN22_15410 [Verrucomicrobiae bacterium]|nr:hypothetical protein [Verrucomicrobiae bacterium]
MIAHLAATWALVGTIWTVQLVHYPLFRHVGKSQFQAYHARHVLAVSWVVVPLTLLEWVTAAVLVFTLDRSFWFLCSLPLLVVIVWSTWRMQVPIHSRLQAGFDEATQCRLERSNWVRTVCWTLRGVLVAVALDCEF